MTKHCLAYWLPVGLGAVEGKESVIFGFPLKPVDIYFHIIYCHCVGLTLRSSVINRQIELIIVARIYGLLLVLNLKPVQVGGKESARFQSSGEQIWASIERDRGWIYCDALLWGPRSPKSSKPETCHQLAQADRKISDDERVMCETTLPDLCASAQIKAGVAPLLPARFTA
ncbi:hypothetical protein EK904_002615 [Melospiza melodia maxima]|nr:hypothetical protein EK904_002615 [Melospiza melodia maxima]